MVKIVYHMHICGVRVDEVTREGALQKVKEFLASDTQHRLFTPNPEMVVAAHNDHLFLNILNRGSLNICDGKGIELLAKKKLERIPGIDFLYDICQLAATNGHSIFLLGAEYTTVVEKAAERLRGLYPGLRVVGVHPGISFVNKKNEHLILDEDSHARVLDQIIQNAPQILFVGFGHSKQEKWIDQFLHELPSVKIAMGVGGAFDVLAGKLRRAPRWMRAVGLEWLWRVILEPWRLGRIFRATLLFLFLFFSQKNSHN